MNPDLTFHANLHEMSKNFKMLSAEFFTCSAKCLLVLRFYSPVKHTFTRQAKSSKRLTSIVHIFLPETDNCPS